LDGPPRCSHHDLRRRTERGAHDRRVDQSRRVRSSVCACRTARDDVVSLARRRSPRGEGGLVAGTTEGEPVDLVFAYLQQWPAKDVSCRRRRRRDDLLQVDDQLERSRLLDRDVGRPCALKDKIEPTPGRFYQASHRLARTREFGMTIRRSKDEMQVPFLKITKLIKAATSFSRAKARITGKRLTLNSSIPRRSLWPTA
jgi:hypothetical protein